jgi:hypothetical protein
MITNSNMNASGFNGSFNEVPCNRCTCCQHSAVCSLKAEYEKAFQQALAVSCKPFELDLKCPHFMSIMQTRTFIYGSGDTNCCTVDSLSTSSASYSSEGPGTTVTRATE